MKLWIVTNWINVDYPIWGIDEAGNTVQTGTLRQREPNLWGATDPNLGYVVRLERLNRCLVKVVCKNRAALKPLRDADGNGTLNIIGDESELVALYPKIRQFATNQGIDFSAWRHDDCHCGDD